MTTKEELKEEIHLFLLDKINEIDSKLNNEALPLMEAINNPEDNDHEYAKKEFEHLCNNAKNLKVLVNKMIETLEIN